MKNTTSTQGNLALAIPSQPAFKEGEKVRVIGMDYAEGEYETIEAINTGHKIQLRDSTHGRLGEFVWRYHELERYTPALSILAKPVIKQGSAIHFKGFGVDAWLTVLMVIRDEDERFETYLVQNPFRTAESDSSPFLPVIYSSRFGSRHIAEIRHEVKELTSLEWRLLAALYCYERYAIYRKLARRHQSTVFSSVTVAPVKTRHGYGFHDELESDWIEADGTKKARRMAKAQEWLKLYKQATRGAYDFMQSMGMSGKV